MDIFRLVADTVEAATIKMHFHLHNHNQKLLKSITRTTDSKRQAVGAPLCTLYIDPYYNKTSKGVDN